MSSMNCHTAGLRVAGLRCSGQYRCFALFAKSTSANMQSAVLTPAPMANTNAVTPPPPANAMSAFIGMMFWIATLIAQNLIIFAGIVIIAVAIILYARKRRIDQRLGGI